MPGHDLIGDDDGHFLAVVLKIVDQIQRLARILGHRDVAFPAEARGKLLAQGGKDSLLVVNTDDVFAQADLPRGQP